MHVRRRPAPGWLACQVWTDDVHNGKLIESVRLWDSNGDLVAQGVLDPVKVTRSALVNATSIAGMLLTTETLIVDKPEDEDKKATDE